MGKYIDIFNQCIEKDRPLIPMALKVDYSHALHMKVDTRVKSYLQRQDDMIKVDNYQRKQNDWDTLFIFSMNRKIKQI